MYIHVVIDELIDKYGVGKLTKILECSRTAIYSWKSRSTAPTATYIPKIAKLSGISADVLLSENGIAPTYEKITTPVYAFSDIEHDERTSMYVMQLIDELIEKLGTAELAKKMDCSRGAIYSWQVRRTVPNIIYLKRLSELTGISADVMLSEDGIAPNLITKPVPVYAWSDIEHDERTPIDTIDAPASLLEQYPAGVFYKLETDSISKIAPLGSYVLVDHAHTDASGIIAIKHSGRIEVGKCLNGATTALISPVSYQESYTDIVARIGQLHVLGRLVFYMGCINS